AGVGMPLAPDDASESAHPRAVIVLPERAERDDFRAALAREGVQTSVHYPPIHAFTAYRAIGARRALPVTETVASRIVTLPLYPHLSLDDASIVVRAATRAAS